jgi:hypothetical protein
MKEELKEEAKALIDAGRRTSSLSGLVGTRRTLR